MKLLDRIHCHLLPRTYVEVGVSTGKSLGLALPGTIAVGIDPEPKIRFAIDKSAEIFAEGSDDFFERHDLRQVLRGNDLDLAFVDGMHLFEYALRDFFHLERFSHAESTIMFHDCKPFDGRPRHACRCKIGGRAMSGSSCSASRSTGPTCASPPSTCPRRAWRSCVASTARPPCSPITTTRSVRATST